MLGTSVLPGHHVSGWVQPLAANPRPHSNRARAHISEHLDPACTCTSGSPGHARGGGGSPPFPHDISPISPAPGTPEEREVHPSSHISDLPSSGHTRGEEVHPSSHTQHSRTCRLHTGHLREEEKSVQPSFGVWYPVCRHKCPDGQDRPLFPHLFSQIVRCLILY